MRGLFKSIGILALCFWAWSPSVAQADDDDWEDSNKYRNYGHRHADQAHRAHGHDNGYHRKYRGRRGARKYVHDDGHCRTTYKRKKHGYKYTVRCRDRDDHGYRQTHHRRYHSGQSYSRDTIAFEPRYIVQTLDSAADGEAIVWKDSRQQTELKIVPTQSYRTHKDGRYCREYIGTASIGGQTREVYGKACRQEDGSWELVR